MSAVDISVHCGEAVGEAFCDEALSGEMVAFVEIVLANDVKDAGIALQACGVKDDAVQQVNDSFDSSLGVLERNPAHDAMHFITKADEMLRQIASCLSGDSGDQRFSTHL